MILLFLALSAVFFASGEFFSKKWADEPRTLYAILLFLSYNVGIALWMPAIRETKTLAVTGMMWLLLGIVATTLIGTMVFHERIDPKQCAGLALATMACVLLYK